MRQMKGEVVVVGAGPAGLMAAREAVNRGAQVTIIDEGAQPGGQIYRQAIVGSRGEPIGLKTERARKERVLATYDEIEDKVDYLANSTAYSLFPGLELHVAWNGESRVMHPDAVVLATGVIERAVPFPGWTLPGVVFAGGVQALLKAHGIRAGNRVVVAGAGPLPVVVASQLTEAGAEVPCVALLNPLRTMLRKPAGLWAGLDVVREGLKYLRALRKAGVERLDGWIPVRAHGDQTVRAVTLAQHDGNGRPLAGTERDVECDVLALNFGFSANSELARMAGTEVRFEPHQGGWIPQTDVFGRSSVKGVLVAGDAAGLRGAWVASAEGQIVGAAAAAIARGEEVESISSTLAPVFGQRYRHLRFQEAVQESLRLPDGVWSWADADTICCRCESVTRAQLERAISDGHNTLNALKRNTRAGMGWCAGRICGHTMAALASGNRLLPEIEPMTPRPVARPVVLGDIARQTQC